MSKRNYSRRDMLKIGAAAGAAGVVGKAYGAVCADTRPIGISDPVSPGSPVLVSNTGCPADADIFPTSPFILTPFVDPLPVPKALRPGYRNPDGTLAATQAWNVRQKNGVNGNFTSVPGPDVGAQDSIGDRPMYNDGKTYTFFNPKTGASTTKTMNFGGARGGTHQLYAGGKGVSYARLQGLAKQTFDLMNSTPLFYHIRYQVAEHSFTSSNVQSIDRNGATVALPPGASAAPGTVAGTFKLPPSTIYGMNGTFPGPLINVTYGQPIVVRYENDLDFNPKCLSRGDFGAPDWAVLTHLHNGHTAPESDGQPNHMQENEGGYRPGQWVDSSYLVYPAGGDDAEKQSFLWFHDHRMHHTGPNVYKGQVGLMPHYDIKSAFNPTGIDGGDETQGLRLPGIRTDNGDGSFDVQYDIPMAFYDFRADDGISPHSDVHQPLTAQGWSNNVCGQTHPEWWGKTFLQHYPNHGFVGDIYTVNGTAYPVLNVDRRHYRFRFLGASLSRQYELSLRQGTIVAAPGQQGQWRFGTTANGKTTFNNGTQCMRMTEIATGGGLLPNPLLRDFLQIWPAKRREVVVDFTVYQDGSKTKAGDVIYLTNTAFMPDGRQIQGSLAQGSGAVAVPLVKFVIAGNQLTADNSDQALSPVFGVKNQASSGIFNPNKSLRPRHTPPGIGDPDPKHANMDFTLQRGGSSGGETEWLINGLQFDPTTPLWAPTLGSFETWGINNGGGGWTHPMHIHMEEHQVVFRTGTEQTAGIVNVPGSTGVTAEDPMGKFDLVMLAPSEQTKVYRGFRTFVGNYVAHCHNLAHEDHNMMFGWALTL
ncbi:MAG TPA: multicopper oxidase domain-containing protein [Anaeromyxobacteraceae bacterium]|nr:multicopper oxidase domain-containing protein [Anaeromyxobacteraceae bacterium]